MMEELAKRFREQLRKKNFNNLEGIWLELIEADPGLDALLAEAAVAEKHAPRATASVLLSVLADSLKEKSRFDEALDVLRRAVALDPDSAELAHEITDCVKHAYADLPDLEGLLHKSGVGYGQSLKDAMPKLDRYLAFVPGACVYDADRGPGRVKKLDLLLDRVTVDFDMGAELAWDVAAASRRLRACAADGYFRRLRTDRPGLLKLAADSPGTLVRLLLRDAGKPMSVADIGTGLSGIVSTANWEGFWNRARKEVARDPHVVCRTVPGRTFQFSETPVAVAETPAQKQARRVEFAADDIAEMSEPRLLAAYEKLKTFPERKAFLEGVAQSRPDDWDRIFAAVFRAGRDNRAAGAIEKALAEKRPELWRVLLDSVLTGYRLNPEAFLWLVEHTDRLDVSGPKGVVVRLLDLLESPGHKTHWTKLRNAMTADDYALVRAALATMDRAEAERLLNRSHAVAALDGYRADEIGALVIARFPDLEQVQADSFIYSTPAGIERAREDLRRMSEEDLPRTAEEIAQARSHGDLSENYEYKAAKEKQARLMARMNRLRDELALARPIRSDDIDTAEISIGCRVALQDAAGATVVYTILGPWDSDHERGVISYLSPFARLLMSKKPGDRAELDGQPHTVREITPGL
ncbi:MAG: GreA/GreB family elongation factor [bacterium]